MFQISRARDSAGVAPGSAMPTSGSLGSIGPDGIGGRIEEDLRRGGVAARREQHQGRKSRLAARRIGTDHPSLPPGCPASFQ